MGNNNIFEIARRAGVSIATVSRALNNSEVIKDTTKKKVLKIVEEMGYHPNVNARRLVNKRSNNIGILFPYNTNIFLDWYLAELLNALQEAINQHNMDFSIYFPESRQKMAYEQFFTEGRVDGLIIGGVTINDTAVDHLVKQKRPFILLGSYTKGLKHNFIDVDNKLIIKEGLNFLYKAGHRYIAALLDNDAFSTGRDRTRTFFRVMKQLNLPIDDNILLNDPGKFDSAYQNTLKILQNKKRSTAIFAMSDLRAAGAYKAIRDSNLKIPEDVSVLGINDIFLTHTLFSPELTTIKIPIKDMVNTAVKKLMTLINDSKSMVKQKIFKPSLIIRKSIKKI